MMNRKLSFEINKNSNINELNKDLSDYKQIRLKFMQTSDNYNNTQRKTFLENFYNAKLNTMFSIIDYHIGNNSLNDKTNPFCLLDNKEEVKKYSAKICHVLANLDISKISETTEMSNLYQSLTDTIENSTKTPKTFLRDNSFWNEFIRFNEIYNK